MREFRKVFGEFLKYIEKIGKKRYANTNLVQEVFCLLTFSPVTLQILPSLRVYMDKQPFRVCDYTVGSMYMWHKFFKTEYAIAAGMLFFRITGINGRQFYTFPIGDGDTDAALDTLLAHGTANGEPLIFADMPKAAKDILLARYGERCTAREWRDSADYLYDYETFLSFPGRHLSGKRNHLKRFYAAHPTCTFKPLTNEKIPHATAFIKRFLAQHAAAEAVGVIEAEEGLRSCDLLENCAALGVTAGCLWESGEILAVAAGEIVGDTLYVHVEKADTRFDGVYQAISKAFATYMHTPDTLYINREDDAGDEGLRRSKLSYRPRCLLDKFSVTIRG